MGNDKDIKPNTNKKKDNRSFCFCMHAQVDCLPGVVLDCNNHKRDVCPLVEEVLAANKVKEEQVKELKEKYRSKGRQAGDTSKKAEKKSVKKDNRSFCFCMGTQVDCLPGVVLDCNNHKRNICPVLLEVLPVTEKQKAKVKDLRAVFDNSKE